MVQVSHQVMSRGDLRLHYAECGRTAGSVPIVLLHGFPELWYAWHGQLQALGGERRVVAPDLPGYGESTRFPDVARYTVARIADDILALADHLDAPRIVLAGHDWGGAIAWQIAMRRPERLERLVIINAPHPTLFARALRRSARQMLASAYILLFRAPFGLAERLLRARGYAALDTLVQRGLRHGYFSPADAEVYRHAWRQPGALTAALGYYRALGPGVGRNALARRIEVPTTVLWGMRDRYLTPAVLDGLERHVSNLAVHRVHDASHWLVHERPALVTAALLGTLR